MNRCVALWQLVWLALSRDGLCSCVCAALHRKQLTMFPPTIRGVYMLCFCRWLTHLTHDRLSDYLFTAARLAALRAGASETIYKKSQPAEDA